MERYVFFNDVESAKKLYALMKDAGMKCTIAPTPRTESKVCGISILYWEETDTEKIQNIIEENHIEIDRFYYLPKAAGNIREKVSMQGNLSVAI